MGVRLIVGLPHDRIIKLLEYTLDPLWGSPAAPFDIQFSMYIRTIETLYGILGRSMRSFVLPSSNLTNVIRVFKDLDLKGQYDWIVNTEPILTPGRSKKHQNLLSLMSKIRLFNNFEEFNMMWSSCAGFGKLSLNSANMHFGSF